MVMMQKEPLSPVLHVGALLVSGQSYDMNSAVAWRWTDPSSHDCIFSPALQHNKELNSLLEEISGPSWQMYEIPRMKNVTKYFIIA